MNVGELCERSVTTAEADENIRTAARRMLQESVGTIVVVDQTGDEPRAIGIVTDRDITTRGVAASMDLDRSALSMVMSVPVISVGEDVPIEEALQTMTEKSVRRLAVTDDKGSLTGILALDDVLELVVSEIDAIGRLIMRHPPTYG